MPRLRRWTMADSARWGRRALLAAFLGELALEFLIALFGLLPPAREPPAAVRFATFVVLGVVLVRTVVRRGDPWRRCLLAAAASLGATAVFVPFGAAAVGLAEEAALGRLLLLGVRVLPPGRSRAAAILVTAAMIAVPLRWGSVGVFFALLVALGATMVLAAGLYLRGLDERRDRAVADVRRAERLQLARELHDFVAHHVTGIVVGAQAAQVLAGTDPARALASLPAIEAAGQQTLASMHRLVGMMRDAEAEADGAAAALPGADAAALRDLVDDFSRTGLPVRLRLDEESGGLPPEVVTSAYRIVREALTNARKYAVGATRVDVDVRRTEAGLLVVVRDDGRGSTVHRRGGGYGLVGLTERAEAVGGRLHAGRHAAGGWEVTAVLPLTGEVE